MSSDVFFYPVTRTRDILRLNASHLHGVPIHSSMFGRFPDRELAHPTVQTPNLTTVGQGTPAEQLVILQVRTGSVGVTLAFGIDFNRHRLCALSTDKSGGEECIERRRQKG